MLTNYRRAYGKGGRRVYFLRAEVTALKRAKPERVNPIAEQSQSAQD
jgi:hypothetical protein